MPHTLFNKRTIEKLDPAGPYQQEAKSICTGWLNGRDRFTLTTSGSTGPPKTIEVSAAQLKASVQATSQALSLGKGTRVLACLNIRYVAGFMMLVRAMELDWEVTLIEPVSNPLLKLPPEAVFDFTALVPMQLDEILANSATAPFPQKLGKILLGGVGLTPGQEERFTRLDQEVYLGYGMTETVSHVALRRLQNGSPAIYRVTGDTRHGTDARGCLFFEGAVTGYRRVQTNDLATLIPGERAFILHGRIDYVVNSGGIKIFPEEMERLIDPVFRENGIPNPFFFWKMPDPRLGEALVLVVEGDPVLHERISGLLQRHTERLKRPRKICFTDTFLKTESSKVDKYRTFEKWSRDHDPLANR